MKVLWRLIILVKLLIILCILYRSCHIIASMNGQSPWYTTNTTPPGITLNDCGTTYSMRECKRRARQRPWIIPPTINSAAGKVKQHPANPTECFIHIPNAWKRCQLCSPAVVRAGTGQTAFPRLLGWNLMYSDSGSPLLSHALGIAWTYWVASKSFKHFVCEVSHL